MSRNRLDRRAGMFHRQPGTFGTGTAAPGRPSPQIGQRHDPEEAAYGSRRGGAMGLLDIILGEAQRFVNAMRAKADKAVRDAVQEQLEPGEEVRIYVGGLDPWDGTYSEVEVGDPRRDELHRPEMEPMRVCGGGACGPQPGRLPQRKDFQVPTSRGTKTIHLGPRQPPLARPAPKPAKPQEAKKRSPSEARPGRGEMKDWFDRWNRDPGLIDHDFARADARGKVA